jgi:hypothetical protein
VEATVVEVIFDPRSADPTDATIDDDELAMVDVPESVQVPTCRAACSDGLHGRSRLGRPDHKNVDASSEKALVEHATRTIWIRTLSIDDESNRDTVGRLAQQPLRELISDHAWPKPELVDVYRGGGRGDVAQHRRIEVPSLDMNLDRRGNGFVEDECEIAESHRRAEEPLCAVSRKISHPLRLLGGQHARPVAKRVIVYAVVDALSHNFALGGARGGRPLRRRRALLAHRDVELGVVPEEFNDHPFAPEIRGVEILEVDVRIASVILAAAVLAQYAHRRVLVRDLAARESAPLDENGLVEVMIEPSLEIVTRHRGHSVVSQSP